MKQMRLEFIDEGVAVHADLLEAEAPKTCAAVWAALPVEGWAHHAVYSGSEVVIYLPRPVSVEPENQTINVLPGDVGYFFIPGGRFMYFPHDISEICWFYRRDVFPRMPTADGRVLISIFAHMSDAHRQRFFDVCLRMRVEGQKRFRVTRVEGA